MGTYITPALAESIAHESGHIVGLLLTGGSAHAAIALPNGSGATSFQRPLISYTDPRFAAIYTYVDASSQTVAAAWSNLQATFPPEREISAEVERFAFIWIVVLMAGALAEGKAFPAEAQGPANEFTDDATKVWNLAGLLELPRESIIELHRYLSANLPTYLTAVSGGFQQHRDGTWRYRATDELEKLLQGNPPPSHWLLQEPQATFSLVEVLAVGAIGFGLASIFFPPRRP